MHSPRRVSPVRPGAKKFVFRFDRRRAGAGRQVEARRGAAERVGEGHDGAAVHDAGHCTQLVAHIDLGDDALWRGFDEAQAERFREEGFGVLVEGVEWLRHGRLLVHGEAGRWILEAGLRRSRFQHPASRPSAPAS